MTYVCFMYQNTLGRPGTTYRYYNIPLHRCADFYHEVVEPHTRGCDEGWHSVQQKMETGSFYQWWGPLSTGDVILGFKIEFDDREAWVCNPPTRVGHRAGEPLGPEALGQDFWEALAAADRLEDL